MQPLLRPPGAFWRDWLRVSAQVFAHLLMVLGLVWVVLGWALPCVAAPPPCGPAPFAGAADADDAWGCACPAPAVRRE